MAAGWIRDLESSDSRIHKEKTIEKALMASKLGSADAQAFLFNCYQAYNPFYVFGVRQVPETQGLTGQPNHWPGFWALLESLRTRSITGNRAREAIETCSQMFDSDEWNKETCIGLYDGIADNANDSFPAFMEKAFHAPRKNGEIIKAGRELIGDRAIFIVKKRYAINIFDKEVHRSQVFVYQLVYNWYILLNDF